MTAANHMPHATGGVSGRSIFTPSCLSVDAPPREMREGGLLVFVKLLPDESDRARKAQAAFDQVWLAKTHPGLAPGAEVRG